MPGALRQFFRTHQQLIFDIEGCLYSHASIIHISGKGHTHTRRYGQPMILFLLTYLHILAGVIGCWRRHRSRGFGVVCPRGIKRSSQLLCDIHSENVGASPDEEGRSG